MPKVRVKPMAMRQSAALLNNPYIKLVMSIQPAPGFQRFAVINGGLSLM
jgi:hypothetical protein